MSIVVVLAWLLLLACCAATDSDVGVVLFSTHDHSNVYLFTALEALRATLHSAPVHVAHTSVDARTQRFLASPLVAKATMRAFANDSSVAAALAAAVHALPAAVRFVLFVHESVLLSSASGDIVTTLRSRLVSDSAVGLVAPLLVEEDGRTVSDAGLAYALETTRPNAEVSWWRDDGDARNAALPHARLRGVPRSDARIRAFEQQWRQVDGVSLALAMMRRADWVKLTDGAPLLTATRALRFIEADLSSRVLRDLSLRVELTATASAVRFSQAREQTSGGRGGDAEIDAFVARHGAHWEKRVRDALRANTQLTYDMECGLGAVLGFTNEALGFVVALEQIVDTRIKVENVDNCLRDLRSAGLEAYQVAAVERMLRKRSAPDDSGIHKVLMLHHDPGRFNTFAETAKCVVGRSMYETDGIPAAWVDSCNAKVHEIFVPSTFNKQTFAAAGVTTPLTVLFEPLDTYRFDASRFVDGGEAATDLGGLRTVHYLNGTKRVGRGAAGDDFRFLSVGKWEARKGFMDLLTAFFDAFDATSRASLWLRTSIDEKNLADTNAAVAEYCKKAGRDVADLPRVLVVGELLPFDELPNFYRAFDMLVSASHGEGWGLPLAEAMAVGVPVMSIEWGGSATLTNGTGAIALNYTLGAVPKGFDGHQWANVDRAALTSELRRAVERGRDDARRRGAESSRIVRERYAQLAVARSLVDRLANMTCDALADSTFSAAGSGARWGGRSAGWWGRGRGGAVAGGGGGGGGAPAPTPARGKRKTAISIIQ
jgi:glycosyltransferase involved in cell wall biosynthesis